MCNESSGQGCGNGCGDCPCAKARAEEPQPEFSRGLSVGFRDRGMGHGDYAVVRTAGDETHLVAELVAVGIEGRHLTFEEINPVYANAHLFAAAPELYDACKATLRKMLLCQRGGSSVFDGEIAAMQAAMTKAVPVEPTVEASAVTTTDEEPTELNSEDEADDDKMLDATLGTGRRS